MSDMISSCLKECATDLNIIQMKKKDYIKKFDVESKKPIIDEMKKLLLHTKENMILISQELELSTGRVRTEFKGRIENVKLEYAKMMKEVDKMEGQLKADILLVKKATINYIPTGDSSIATRMENNTQNLYGANRMANEIVDRDKNTATELRRQGDQLEDVRERLNHVEGELTIIQQITDVMKYNDLFYRLKLYGIVVLLGLGIIILLAIKL